MITKQCKTGIGEILFSFLLWFYCVNFILTNITQQHNLIVGNFFQWFSKFKCFSFVSCWAPHLNQNARIEKWDGTFYILIHISIAFTCFIIDIYYICIQILPSDFKIWGIIFVCQQFKKAIYFSMKFSSINLFLPQQVNCK